MITGYFRAQSDRGQISLPQALPGWKNVLGSVLAALIIGLSIYSFLSGLHLDGVIDGLFNSDQILVPYLYRDLVQYHHSLKYWVFCPTNFMFPDTLIYFLVAPFFNNFKLAYIFTSSVMLIGYYLLIILVGKAACGNWSKTLFKISALMAIILINSQLHLLFYPIFTEHFGTTVLLYLLELYLIIKLWQRPSKVAYAALIIIPFLAIVSDPLSQGPLICSTIVGMIGIYPVVAPNQRPLLLKTAILLAIAGLAGALAAHLPIWGFHMYVFHLKYRFNFHRIVFLCRAFWYFTKHNPGTILILLANFIAASYFFYRFWINKNNNNIINTQQQYSFFVLFSIASCLPVLALLSVSFDIDLVAHNFKVLLHFMPAILLPAFLGFPILLTKYVKSVDICKLAESGYIYIVFILLSLILVFGKYPGIKPAINYYPGFAKCLDDYYGSGQLFSKNGVSEYWDAHANSMLTKNNINIVTTMNDNSTDDWISTEQDYLGQTFTFAILRKGIANYAVREKGIASIGSPTAILTCPGDNDHTIYTFKQGFSLKKGNRTG